MEIIRIEVTFASGMTITDTVSIDTSQRLHVSERLQQLLREMDKTEALPVITCVIAGRIVEVSRRGDLFEILGELPS
ncbi:hypothetical protein [Paraburkholderia unamae]|uniref:Uncharacterized protein n=2 Tax=Paraburkholderia unamae TaxID=219649 RepID=A0ABX5KXD0_9BURK|nr:hypothetical protein [Paraburkholderia unamae]PVX85770.1 hypothetical protein C7402_103348 [Paraburkholderia unamae]